VELIGKQLKHYITYVDAPNKKELFDVNRLTAGNFFS
jgi:hypothetical protein